VENYTMQEEYLVPGADMELSVTLMNTHASKHVRNVKVTLEDAAGQIVTPQGAQLVPEIRAGQTSDLVIILTAIPMAKDGMHMLELSLEYEDTRNGQYSEKAKILCPVRHEMRLEYTDPVLPSVTVQGETPAFSMALMNMGKGEIRNALVTLELPGISHGGSVLAGTIPSGETKEVRTSLSVDLDAVGKVDGEVVLSFEDSYGISYERRIPITTTIEKKTEIIPMQESEDPEFPWKKFAIAMTCAAVALLVAAIAAWVRILQREKKELAAL